MPGSSLVTGYFWVLLGLSLCFPTDGRLGNAQVGITEGLLPWTFLLLFSEHLCSWINFGAGGWGAPVIILPSQDMSSSMFIPWYKEGHSLPLAGNFQNGTLLFPIYV